MDILSIKQQLQQVARALITEHYPESLTQFEQWHLAQLFAIPERPEFGFLTTMLALQLSPLVKDRHSNPRAVAETLLPMMQAAIANHPELKRYIASIDIAGPGFLNFHATTSFYADVAQQVLANPMTWGKTSYYEGKHILVEFTDPNPFKEFHIGHLVDNCVGESIARLFECAGGRVTRLCYQGDVGMHVAKTLWAWQKALETGETTVEQLLELPLNKRTYFLGQWYAQGSVSYAEGTDVEKEAIKTINAQIFSRENEELNALYDLGRKWSLQAFDVIYHKLGTQFDRHYFESTTGPLGKQLVEGAIGTVFTRSNGAVIFAGEEYGLHSRVFINSQNLPTYEAKELGLAITKDTDYQYDLSVVITGNEVVDYFKVLMQVIKLIRPSITEKMLHISHGMLRLPQGKMSSRTGNVITGDGLITQVADAIGAINPDADVQLRTTLAVAALKFGILKQNVGKDIIFTISESVSLQGATGVYLEYTHARACSVLKKAGFLGTEDVAESIISDATLPLHRIISQFPHITSQASAMQAPSIVANYLLELSQAFNTFYAENRIIAAPDEAAGLLVTYLTKTTLERGLSVLGITAVAEM